MAAVQLPIKSHALNLLNLVKSRDTNAIELLLKTEPGVPWTEIIVYEFDMFSLVNITTGDDQELIENLLHYEIKSVTPFHLAAILGLTDTMVSFLIKGIPVDYQTTYDSTVIQLASFGGHLDAVRILFEAHRANVDLTDKNGWTALHHAASQGHDSVVLMLIWFGADVFHQDANKKTAAIYAQNEGHEKIVNAMIELGGADVLTDGDPVSPPAKAPLQRHKSLPVKRAPNRAEKFQPVLEPRLEKPPKRPPLPMNTTAPDLPARKNSAASDIAKGDNNNNDEPNIGIGISKERHSTLRKILREELGAMFDNYLNPTAAVAEGHQVRVGATTLRGLLKEELKVMMKEQGNLPFAQKSESDYATIPAEGEIPYEAAPVPPSKSPQLPPRTVAPSVNDSIKEVLDDYDTADNLHQMLKISKNSDDDDDYQTADPGYDTLKNINRSKPPVPPKPAKKENPPSIRLSSHPKFRKSQTSITSMSDLQASPRRDSQTSISSSSSDIRSLLDSKVPPPTYQPRLSDLDHRPGYIPITMNNQMDAKTIETIFHKIATQVGGKWKMLAEELRITAPSKMQAKLIQIVRKSPIAEVQAYLALEEWRLNCGNDVTLDNLIYAMRACNLYREIEEVQRITQEFSV